ncbi:MAG: hypothetical protein JRJ45_00010 [Deltaproteobacteria bacterium]|nr:hypothetical protein [Deltaproteobacteria bacterium]
MAELRLDQVEAAFEATPQEFGTAEPTLGLSPDLMSLDQLQLFGNDQEIERKSYDLWYEKALEGMVKGDVPVLDWAAEPAAGILNYVPDIANTTVLGVTSTLGNIIESFSSPEKLKEGVASVLGAAVAGMLYLDDPLVYQQNAEAMGLEPPIKGPGDVADTADLFPSPDANIAERVGKRMRALSFYGYANAKGFQQSLSADADHPLLMQIGGAFGSISTSALLASVNPQLAMWAIGGHAGANQYLEQTARGADFVPALGFGSTIGVGVSQLEKMSISLLFKKYSSRLALAGDSAITNAIEEFSQSTFESGVEQAFGAEDRTLGQILKEASFEAALGFVGGGAAGATSVQFAYNRMDKALREIEIPKQSRHHIIMKSISEGSSILENVLREGLGATESDLDIVNKISTGEINASEALVELNKRIAARQKAKGIDTYLDSDPDALIEEQKRIDAAEQLAAQTKVPLTPDEQAEASQVLKPADEKPVTEIEALEKVSQFVASHDLGSQQIKDGEGNIVANVNPGMPDGLEGVTTKQIEAVLKNVKEGKALTENQEEVKQKMLQIADEMGLTLEGQVALSKTDKQELKVLREGREAQINQELDLIESQKAAILKELQERKDAGKSTKAQNKKLDSLGEKSGELLDEIELLPTAQREDLAKKVVASKGQKISALKNLAEVVAARLERAALKEQFRTEKNDLSSARNRLAAYVRDSFKGRAVPKKFVTRVAKVTQNTLDKFLAEVDQERLAIVKPALLNQINRVLGKVAPKVKGGKSVGVLKSASLQDVANELIRVSKIDGQTAAQLLRQKQTLLKNYFNAVGTDNAVAGEIDVDRLNFEMEVLQNLAGLDVKSEEELMTALKYVQDKVQTLKMGQKIKQQQLKEQREQERASTIDQMTKKAPKFVPKWLRTFTHYSTSNLSSMLRSLIGTKDIDTSTLGKKIAALDEAPRKEASFNYLYMNALENITKRAFGLKDNKEYAKWKADWFTEGKGYDSGEDIEFNDGSKGRLLLSKADVSYWWMVTHDKNGNELPEMVEQFTGENARNDLEEKAFQDGDEDVDLSQVRGNAIPLEHWQQMMEQFESNEAHVEFAQSQRALYNTVYSIINPVYRMYMGTDLPRVEDYIPWHRDVGIESEVFSALDDFNDLIQTTPRATKLRTPGASAAFRQVGDIEIFQYFVQEMAHFNAFALPMKDLISVIRNKEVRQAINRTTDGVELAGGTVRDGDFYKNMRKMADFIMSRGRSMNEFSLGLFNTMRSNISIAYLGEPSKAVMQTSSMWMALTEKDVTWGDWMAGFAEFMSDPSGTLEILAKAPMMKFRYRDLMIEMRDAIEHIKRKDKTKVDRFRKWVTPKAFAFVRAGNRVGAGISGWVIFRKVYNETGDINEAFRRFDQHLVDTQQSAVGTQLSPFQAGQTARLLSHFQSAVIQYVRIYTKTWDDYLKGRIGLKKLLDTMIVFHVLMPTMRWMLKALIRGGDFEADELAKDIVIGPLTAGFVIPDIIEGLISVAMDVHSFGAGSTLAGASDKIVNATKQIKKKMAKAMGEGYYDVADLANAWIELGEEASALTLPIPGIAYDGMQAAIKFSQGELTPLQALSVIMGESVESLEFKNKGSNNRTGNLFRR